MPSVSIILPTYNRARFLPEAFASIESQTFRDWELIVVDDGSTDDTRVVVEEWQPKLHGSIRYIWQKNAGPAGARNSGLDHVHGDFVACFDSDDLWLSHHLERCIDAFSSAPDVDWIYAPCRAVDQSGTVVHATTFETAAGPRPFLRLRTRRIGALHIIDDPDTVACQLTGGLYAGLQNSVIRARVFARRRFWPEYRVGEDVLFLIGALLEGMSIGYLTDVHVIYRIHDDNSSGSRASSNRERLARIRSESIAGLERLDRDLPLTAHQRAALRQTLGRHYFWDLGYVCYWQGGERTKAFEAFKRGLKLNPTDARMWKTYALSLLRSWWRPQSAH